MAFTLPDLSGQEPICDPDTGLPSAYFTDWVARVLRQIIAEDTNQDNLIAQLQSVQGLLQAQQLQIIAAINAINHASGSTTAGSAQGDFDSLTTSTWTHGPTVHLTSVAAGHLVIFGSGPTQGNNTGVNAISGIQGNFNGDWRIQEIISGVETTVYGGGGPTGNFFAQRYRDDQGIENVLYSTDDTSQVSIARSTTGTIDYRLDFRSPSCDITQATLYLNVSRGT